MAWDGKRWVEKSSKGHPTAILYPVTANRKLAPVQMVANTTKRLRPVPSGPFVSSTYASISATCPSTCPFRANGCYVTEGFYSTMSKFLDANAVSKTPLEVIQEEGWAIEQFARKRYRGESGIPQDGGKNGDKGRDLRLHVGGDIQDPESAAVLGNAAAVWKRYGGGRVWTYTHAWRAVRRAVWGESVSVLASVESVPEIKKAMQAGYAAAIVLPALPGPKAWQRHGYTFIPCPAETSKKSGKQISCVECRLCMDADKLHARKAVIAFGAHGLGTGRIKNALDKKPVRRLTVVQ